MRAIRTITLAVLLIAACSCADEAARQAQKEENAKNLKEIGQGIGAQVSFVLAVGGFRSCGRWPADVHELAAAARASDLSAPWEEYRVDIWEIRPDDSAHFKLTSEVAPLNRLGISARGRQGEHDIAHDREIAHHLITHTRPIMMRPCRWTRCSSAAR